jgi:hypothetical protein
MGEIVSKGELMYILTNGLPKSYSSIIQSLRVNDKLEFDEACQHIRDYQETLLIEQQNNKVSRDSHAAMHVNDRQQFGNKSNVNGNKSRSIGNFNKSRFNDDYNNNRKVMTCHTCGNNGHVKFNCIQNAKKAKCNFCRQLGHVDHECQQKAEYQKELQGQGHDHAAMLTLGWDENAL